MAETTLVQKVPTVLEIARKAKVSRAAVYAVLNAEKPTNIGISTEKRHRILEVARNLGYIRNELARSMVTGKTHTIGVLVYSLKTTFFMDYFTLFDDACYHDGYSVLVASSEYNLDREARNLRTFLAKRVDAVVVGMDFPNPNDAILKQFIAKGIPVIHFGGVGDADLPFPAVGFDETRVGEFAAEHLWSLGHRKVLYCNAGKTKDDSLFLHQDRFKRFWAAWKKISHQNSVDLFQAADPMHGGIELAEYLGKMAPENRPTAVACSIDRLAISACSALRMHQIRVPDDLSIIGCDDITAAGEALVPLTTVRLPTEKLAQGPGHYCSSGSGT
jgi:LacI family transcriptional regulator